MTIPEIEEEIAKKSSEREDKQKKLKQMEDKKNRDQKAKAELRNEVRILLNEITMLEEEHYRQIPLQDKLPKHSTYYKHFMQKQFTSNIEELAQK
jgi:CMP-N-acetylneuraminic acid synthetase